MLHSVLVYNFKHYYATELHALEGLVVRTAAPAQLCGKDYRICLFWSSLQPYLSDF